MDDSIRFMSKTTQGHRTYEVLHLIARRLAGRIDCTNIEYQVVITPDCVVFSPENTYVYPDRYNRKYKCSILEYILTSCFPDIVISCENNEVHILPNSLLCGEYRYIQSYGGKYRTWMKLK